METKSRGCSIQIKSEGITLTISTEEDGYNVYDFIGTFVRPAMLGIGYHHKSLEEMLPE